MSDSRRASPSETAHQLHEIITLSAMPPPSAEQIEARRHTVRLVAEDLDTGEQAVLADGVPWRSVEVLGSAALYYAAHYDNPARPTEQVRARRRRANELGARIWDVAESRVGIEAPERADGATAR